MWNRKQTLLLALALTFTTSINALPVQNSKARKGDPNAPIKLAGVIAIPGKELPFSYAMGSTQRLANGNYVFDDSFQFTNTNPAKSFAQVYELSPSGTPLYGLQLFGDSCYRGYRLVTLYEGSAPVGKGGAEAGDEGDDDKGGDDR